ncbi:histidine phosphatase family protein [Actinoplanes sp. NPDC051470]|uniref:SixA phosphatase family protein n=1 Tax=unclassified Actinoplanes TaxID=2626549 RepID=UPI00343E86E0
MTEKRTLVLLRHAKAETPGDHLDFDRRLTEKGAADADAAGAWLADEGLAPGLVICSPAARTRQTWHAAAVALAQAAPSAPSPEVHYENGLYEGGRTEVIDLLRRVPDDVATVLIVGHNPTMSDVSVLLRSDREDPDFTGLKTCGLAIHHSGLLWSDTEPGSMDLLKRHTARG